MRVIDTEIRGIGRTPRELLLIAGGLAIILFELYRPATNPWHLLFYVTATTLFALRFFAARVVAVGLMVSALGLGLIYVRHDHGWPLLDHDCFGWHIDSLWWGFWAMLAGLFLLLSRDLRQRFDLAPSGLGWRLNRWRDLPRLHWLASCWICYLLGLLGNLLLLSLWYSSVSTTWIPVLLVAMFATVILFFMGRSIAFVAAAVIAAIALWMIVPDVAAAEAYLDRPFNTADLDPIWAARPAFALPAAISAGLVLLLSLPYAALHLAHSLRAAGPRAAR